MKNNVGDTLQQADKWLIEALVNKVQVTLHKSLAVVWTPHTKSVLSEIFKTAHDLCKLMCRQRACFQVWMVPAIANQEAKSFDPHSMEVIDYTEDEGSIQNKALLMSVFPVVYKLSETSAANVSCLQCAPHRKSLFTNCSVAE